MTMKLIIMQGQCADAMESGRWIVWDEWMFVLGLLVRVLSAPLN